MRDPNQVSLYLFSTRQATQANNKPPSQSYRTMTITDATNAPAPAPVPAEDVSIERFVDPSVAGAGAGAADRRKSSVSTFVRMGSRS